MAKVHLDLKEEQQAVEALVRWFETQRISPEASIPIMVLALHTAIMAMQDVIAKRDNPDDMKDFVIELIKETKSR